MNMQTVYTVWPALVQDLQKDILGYLWDTLEKTCNCMTKTTAKKDRFLFKSLLVLF